MGAQSRLAAFELARLYYLDFWAHCQQLNYRGNAVDAFLLFSGSIKIGPPMITCLATVLLLVDAQLSL
jgi:hypothetical protein